MRIEHLPIRPGLDRLAVVLVKTKGLEGIIAKREDSIYRPGNRTSDLELVDQQRLRAIYRILHVSFRQSA